MSNDPASKENAAWDQLSDLATELLPQYGARPAAFREASRRRPDLASAAIDPFGKPLMGRTVKSAGLGMIQGSPIVQAAARLAQVVG